MSSPKLTKMKKMCYDTAVNKKMGVPWMIRLVATDLDGTLLEDGRLPEGTFEAVRALKAAGVRFAAASGRTYGNLRRLFAPVADEIAYVCENGAMCVADGVVSDIIAIPPAEAREIIADIEAAGMNLLISGRHTTYLLDQNRKYTDDIVYRLRNTVTIVDSPEDIAEPMLKISGQIDQGLEQIAPVLLQKWSGRATATVSGQDWFDFTWANKGQGMQNLLRRLGIPAAETAAFGDNFNDETMLDLVGYPFIMIEADKRLHKPDYRLCEKELPILRRIAQSAGRRF